MWVSNNEQSCASLRAKDIINKFSLSGIIRRQCFHRNPVVVVLAIYRLGSNTCQWYIYWACRQCRHWNLPGPLTGTTIHTVTPALNHLVKVTFPSFTSLPGTSYTTCWAIHLIASTSLVPQIYCCILWLFILSSQWVLSVTQVYQHMITEKLFDTNIVSTY